ncbi:hypothetical protein [Pseudodesulfovibrio sp. zrk46]|uniref:DUF6933 domain-containing protein n=1 Tax=Pseudodesulfovibrio sp. zrk46 TaxID=2725288 RepID=UPI001449918D|nr:hypothetical protein [Pseudodesulfovibrio sp. zrk46]QJB56538.1 hypothetical protein HFN16_09005 [Pseudodesulfovibrio sp. zrk46]
MAYIFCTQKLAKELASEPLTPAPDVRGFLGWHGTILRIFRRKSVLLVNDESRFTLFIPGLMKKDFANFQHVFIHHFERTLGYMNANPAQIAQAKLLLGGFSYHKTHNRSVLGTLNDMKDAVEFMLKSRLGHLPESEEEHRWVASFLNETPCRGKDLKGVVFPDREILKMINRVG